MPSRGLAAALSCNHAGISKALKKMRRRFPIKGGTEMAKLCLDLILASLFTRSVERNEKLPAAFHRYLLVAVVGSCETC